MKQRFLTWKSPGAWARFTLSAAIMAGGCALFSPLVILGPYVTVNPMIGLAVFFGIAWGPAGVAGTALGVLAGDAVSGLHALTPWRISAWTAAAAVSTLLWRHEPFDSRSHRNRFSRLHYILSVLPAAWLAAAVESLGADIMKLYPFSYVFSITAVHHLLWCAAPAPAVYALGWGVETFPDSEPFVTGSRSAPVGTGRLLVLWTGALGSGLSGLILSYWFYGMAPFRPYMLSVTTGLAVYAGVVLFVLIALAGVLIPLPRKHNI